MTAYYNEFDPKAASWLRQLITNGDIAPGIVDERSITEVHPDDLKGFERVHFFAGIGTWDYCLTNAGFTGNVWTASLPCQPFSKAGKRRGKEDERHLLPHFLELVRECRPDLIFGEQVESAIKHGWLDDLYTEMEAENYTVGSAILGAHSVNSAHIRKRIYWVAHTNSLGSQRPGIVGRPLHPTSGEDREIHRVVDDGIGGRGAHSINEGSQRRVSGRQDSERENINRRIGCGSTDSIEWLYCRDGKHRPVQEGITPLIEVKKTIKSGIEPLVDGATGSLVCGSDTIDPNNSAEARTIRLKGYGNAIVAPVATEFIRATMEVIDEKMHKM
jgi:DNA (cytosine-5)-methyltransferase 1